MKIQMFCCIGPYKFGFGITPENAFENAVKAGLDRSKRDDCVMYAMPEGISSVDVTDFGGIQWNYPEGASAEMREAKPTKRYFDASEGQWTPTKVENKKPEGDEQSVFVKLEGYIVLTAKTPQEALDEANDICFDDLAELLYEAGDYDVVVKNKKAY